MPMKVEAAIVTQKRPEAVYNTDSVNVNGKVMPREVIKNGYKGSGVLSGRIYFALTSSAVEGFADASVAAFNDRAGLFARSREPMSVFSGFFEDCRGALLNTDHSPEDLVGIGFYASGRRAVIALNGATRVYLQRLGVASPVTAEKVADTTADFSGAVFSDVCEGDIFILLSPGAAEVLGDKEIDDILRISDGSVKRVVNYILKVALAADGDKAVSAIVIKVLETDIEEEISAPAFAPDFSEETKEENAEPAAAAKADAASEVSEEADASDTDSDDAAVEEAAAEVNDADDIANIFAKNALSMFESTDDIVTAEKKNDTELYTEEIGNTDAAEDADNVAEEGESHGNQDNKKSRTPLFAILGIMLAVSLALIIAFVVVPAFSDGNEETTTEETTTETESTDEATTDEETTDEETTAEETSSEEASAEETTTVRAAEETTARPPVAEATTSAPVVAPEQTTAPEEEPEATTEAEETTAAENTTAAEEATTEAVTAENTTSAPSTEASEEAPEEAPAENSEETEAVQ
ncbi:MAG: hypothetical protein IJN70_05340 [Clostridia bacterium]|nr:hypothetical protein [Clostridia bacterium]